MDSFVQNVFNIIGFGAELFFVETGVCIRRKVGEMLMKDQYAEVWEEITKAFNKQSKMIVELAARTLSVKDYKEFVDEFSKKEDNKDDLIEDLMQKGR